MDDDYNIKSFSGILPKASSYVKCYDGETKWMYVLTADHELLKKI